MNEAERTALEAATGSRITGTQALGAGTSGSGTRLTRLMLADGRALVAKRAEAAFAKLDLEGWMLRYLAEHSALPVPAVWHAEPGLLVMDCLPDGGGRTGGSDLEAADALAALHDVSADLYGLERDTLIGPLDQPNALMADWRPFFAGQRLLHMARLAVGEGRLENADLASVERLCDRLDQIIPAPAAPSLIHGDVWGGNVITGPAGLSGFIDPAIYFADAEIELAFTTLFGTFGPRFYDRYAEHRPIVAGFFEERRDLYNLYPLLVHVRLFGGSYAGQFRTLLRRFA